MDEADGDAPDAGLGATGVTGGGAANNDLLVELARRLLSRRYPGDNRAGTPRLLPGEVPAEVLAEVPLPEDNRIIGSLVLPTHVTAVVESGMRPDELRAFYKERMVTAGWTEPDPLPGWRAGGFQHDFLEETLGSVFCRGPRGPELRIELTSDQGALTEVRLHYNTDTRGSICAQLRHRRLPMDMPDEIIPALRAPSGSVQIPRGGSSGGDHWETSAFLKSNLDLASVATHYGQQLRGAGWQEQESGETGQMAWSTYAFRDKDGEDWDALFFVVSVPKKEGVYHLFVQATIAGSEEIYLGGLAFSRNVPLL